MERSSALDRVESVLDAVDDGLLPVPVREVWVYGDVALGLDPVDRLDVYVTKDLLLGSDADTDTDFESTHGVKGVGQSVSAEWAEANPHLLRTNGSGYAAPEKCLAAHLLPEDEPVHLEVCNASFEDNVRQRLKGALAREAYEEILDPRGVCLYAEGRRSDSALEKLRAGELAFPTLPESLSMLGVDDDTAAEAAEAVTAYRASQSGRTVRGDVV
ncbi:DUF7095 family protein [Halobellus limi]|uniref:Uncharacterized protein n=1 Tax=Halobellus limi TaxID=699433 RepID=A0A1H5YLI9_9EURY|nr:hypothetical protein [Halobellus limi]QCC48404.1 hypothetical protein DV707_12425 [Halobellus limi]SEG25019.1 hypothetical protein SAMN04488133_1647 [Halobellus limi]